MRILSMVDCSVLIKIMSSVVENAQNSIVVIVVNYYSYSLRCLFSKYGICGLFNQNLNPKKVVTN